MDPETHYFLVIKSNENLSLYHNWHHHWCTTGQKITILGDLTTKSLNEFSSFNLWIFCENLLVCRSDSLEYLLVDIHHLIRMNESARINKDMTSDRTSPTIFFESENKYSILSKLFSITKCITSNNSNRETIDKKRIESKLHSITRYCRSLNREHFTSNKCLRTEHKTIRSDLANMRDGTTEICRYKRYMSKSKC